MVDFAGRELHRDMERLTRLAKDDLRGVLARARTMDQARFLLAELMPTLIERYGNIAATLAADWYDEVRAAAEAQGAFSAVMPEDTDPGVHALLGWAYSKTDDLVTFQSLVLGGGVRRVLQYGRSVVTRSAVADPGAAGWQRQGDGDSCAFCAMLIGRGAVYSESTVDFASHDNCGCIAVVAWKGRSKPVRLRADGTRASKSNRASRTDDEKRRVDNERVRAWLEANPNAG